MNESLIHSKTETLLEANQALELKQFVSLSNGRVIYSDLVTTEACIYAFWIKNIHRTAELLHRELCINGPKGKPEKITWDWNLHENSILLYVGKTTNFKSRIKKHLLLGTNNWEHKPNNYLNKKTTACQLRAGIEHLLKHSKPLNTIDFMLNNILVNAVKLDELTSRFYAEDLAIGKGKPWFNIDSER